MKKNLKKVCKFSKNDLPKGMFHLPKSLDTFAPYLIVPFRYEFIGSTKIFTGFDTFLTNDIRTDLRFQFNGKSYDLIAIEERLVDMFSYQTIWKRTYENWTYFKNASIKPLNP